MAAGSLETVKLVSDVASNVVTVVALLVGAGWAGWAFLRERVRWPKADLELEVSHRQLTADEQLLHVKVNVENTGRSRIVLTELRVDVYRVLPLDEETKKSVRERNLVRGEGTEAAWPGVTAAIRQWAGEERPGIEPGEGDEYCFDFVVPGTLRVAFVYVYVHNFMKKRRTMGWPATVLYDLEEKGDLGGSGAASATRPPQQPLRGRTQPFPRPSGQQPPRPPLIPEQGRPRPTDVEEQS
jgi:hypothetical protein